MRIATIVSALVVTMFCLAGLPAMATSLSVVECSEIQLRTNLYGAGSFSGEHPEDLQTVFLVSESMNPQVFGLKYNLTRPGMSVVAPLSAGRLIGQVTVYRDGKVLFRSAVKRVRMMTRSENDPWIKEASLAWQTKMDLLPGDLVIFGARFRNTPDMHPLDWVTLSGEIYREQAE